MKSIRKTQPVIINYLVSASIILFFVVISSGCKHGWKDHITNGYPDTSLFRPDPKNQLVIWRKPGTTDKQLTNWIDSVEHAGGTVNIPVMCQDCDNSLMLLTGPGITNFIQQSVVTGGGGSQSGGGPSGDSGPLLYSVNYGIDFGDSIFAPNLQSANVPHTPPNPKNQPNVTVAVFDTGIDSLFFNSLYFYHKANPSCLGPDAVNGWNFSSNSSNKNWADDFPQRHGTVVSKFIVDEVNAGDSTGNGIKLLPVKIHNYLGVSDLFSVLCGFSYAANSGAQIINASFGFYTPLSPKPDAKPDANVVLLKEYVKAYLTKNNILLIAAAGNKVPMEDTSDFANLSDNGKRNLDSVNFYPASLAADADLPNVIAVTTVNDTNATVCPVQNYSPRVVDIGVNADNSTQYTFINPFDKLTTVIGSSFATPIVTGKICSNYYLFKTAAGQPGFNKKDIINILMGNHLAHNNPVLIGKISNGVVMNK